MTVSVTQASYFKEAFDDGDLTRWVELHKCYISECGALANWLEYAEKGILPLTSKSAGPLVPTTKSIQYSVRHYVDVKVCRPIERLVHVRPVESPGVLRGCPR